MRTIDLRGKRTSASELARVLPRAVIDIEAALAQVLPIIDAVATRGEAALVEFAQKFDGVDPRPIRVSTEELESALENLDANLRAAIEVAIERVRKVAKANLPTSTETTLAAGAVVSQRWIPVDSVGLYVPGGKAVYPSSVVMNVVPAQVAGVPRLALITPPQKDFGGRPHPTVLATAALLGVTEVYAMGGPAGIAALAHGVESLELEPVQLVTGPGNNFVTAAKRALRGKIGIDSEAGATEIMIIADDSANFEYVSADLISQAEHDESAAAVLVTTSESLAAQVARKVAELGEATTHTDRVKTALAGQQSAIVLVDDLSAAADVANAYATEHLELQTERNDWLLSKITNAGAIFVGDHSPVSLGDYMAGSNHVLPTGGQAKFGSGLGVHSFLRAQQVINYSASALAEIAVEIDLFARAEGLPAHGDAIKTRD
jgi:histidinol dehydrogenase